MTNYLSFSSNGTATWGIEADGTVYDLGPTGANLASSIKNAIETGIFGTISEDQYSSAPSTPLDSIEYLPSVIDPLKILCIGVNYQSHMKETGKGLDATTPTVFTRYPDSQIAQNEPAIKTSQTEQFDYEGELAVVIGKEASRVSAEEAGDYVAAYGIYNDFTYRDWQRATTQWVPGKTFPGTGAFGPFLVPAAEFEEGFDDRILETRVNGDVRQHTNLGDLHFKINQLVAHCAGFTPLKPGDVIITGTPGGVGLFMDPPALLEDGDEVEVEITGLGILRNKVKAVD